MSRSVGLALLVVSAAIGGVLLALLLPRESGRSGGPTPVLVATQMIPGASQTTSTAAGTKLSDRRFTAMEVRRAFRRQGLPLREFAYGDPDPRIFTSVRGGPIFAVYVFGTVEDAFGSQGLFFSLWPANYHKHGAITNRRKANVVVVFEEGRVSVRRRMRAALDSLD